MQSSIQKLCTVCYLRYSRQFCCFKTLPPKNLKKKPPTHRNGLTHAICWHFLNLLLTNPSFMASLFVSMTRSTPIPALVCNSYRCSYKAGFPNQMPGSWATECNRHFVNMPLPESLSLSNNFYKNSDITISCITGKSVEKILNEKNIYIFLPGKIFYFSVIQCHTFLCVGKWFYGI